jgi:exopolysaccharide biosynthesis polyprenyl glycosylphosphotransferase
MALRALEAQRILDLVALRAAPALVAGLIAYLHMGEIGSAALVAGTMLAAAHLLEHASLPLALMPAARVTVGITAPLVAAAAVVLVTLAAGKQMPLSHLEAPVIGALLVTALGAWVKVRFGGETRARVAVIGPPGLAIDLAGELEAAGIRAYEVIGWFGPGRAGGRLDRLACLGDLDEIRSAVIGQRIELLVAAREDAREGSGQGGDRDVPAVVANACLDLPVRMIDANQFYEELFGHVPLGTIDSAWFRYIMHPRFRPTSPLSKRLFDLVVGAVMAIAALPVVAVAAAAIKLHDRGPVLYRQRRVGEGGREFEILKLRTMVPDAEAAGPRWCEAGDERVTALGKLLRRTHIDELPQLWNVLRGEMTLVGPRPERPEIVWELEQRFPHYVRRHLVKPGVTGWAQLRCGYAGSELGTAWKLCHDLFYVKRRSILADWLIIVETAFQAGRDAHRALRAPRQRFIVGEAARD